MTYQAKNNAFSTLAGSLTNVATTLTVQAGHGDRFPVIAAPDYTMVTLEDNSGNREIVKVTARASASDSMTITRAQEGTTARAWASGDSVELRLTAGEIQTVFDHVDDPTAAHAASAISNTPSGNLAATTVQGALDELQSDVDSRELSINTATAKVTPVDTDATALIDSADANKLKKVTWANVKATLKAYFDTLYATATSLTTHTGAASGAHAATAISNTPAGNIAATTVQAAINELDSEKHPLMTSATQVEMEAGTEAALRAMSPLRVKQAISALASATGTLIGFRVYTASGTYSKGTNNPSFVVVEVLGGGGGGGGGNTSVASSGGGGGGYAMKKIAASSLAASETVTVGGGGAGGVPLGAGGNGGTSSFGSFVSATGGSGAAYSTNAGGDSGTGVGGDLNLKTQVGEARGSTTQPGNGGGSIYCVFGFGRLSVAGTAGGANTGCGGGGGAGASNSGGAGGSGLVIVWEYK